LGASIALIFAWPARGEVQFELTPLALSGDNVPGVGAVVNIRNLAVNNRGHTLVECLTNAGDPDRDIVLFADGVLVLQEGDPLPAPPGATIDYFDTVNLNNGGYAGWNLALGKVQAGFDSGVYLNASLVLQEGDFSMAPQYAAPAPYAVFLETAVNDLNEIAVVADVDDPAHPGLNRAIVIVTEAVTGGLGSETIVANEGMLFLGIPDPIATILHYPHTIDLSNLGQTMYVADLAGSASEDGLVCIDQSIIAREGHPSPVAGRSWGSLGPGTVVDLNHRGDWLLRAKLGGSTQTDDVIVVNNQVFKQAGDAVPGVLRYSLVTFGAAGPARIDDAGAIIWYGCWDDPNPNTDCGLFRNNDLLLREGVSTIGGIGIASLSADARAFTISDDGRHIVFEATLADGRNGAFLLKFIQPCPADCGNNDSVVGIADLLSLLTNWGGGGACDINEDGLINILDLLELLGAWGGC
jgi:hypothetical protein